MEATIETFFLNIAGRKIEVQRLAGQPDKPALVLLHEGLGSVSLWRDFPSNLAARTGCPIVVYSRYGYGNSDVFTEPRTVRYMHDEALSVLPQLLAQLEIEEPILLGHSDGGSISLIYTGAHDHVKALILFAPHVFVEEISVSSIAAAKTAFETTDLPQKLARHHRDGAATFWGWNNVWLDPDFRNWNIEEYLPRIMCPILAIQGAEDEYGTMAQLDAIRRQVDGPVEIVSLDNCRHSLHRDHPEDVLAAIESFLDRLPGRGPRKHDNP